RVRRARCRTGCALGAAAALTRIAMQLVGDADPQSPEAPAFVLDLDDGDAADVLGARHVRPAIRLLIETDDVDDPYVLDLGRHQVGGGPDDVRQLEGLRPRKHPYVDAPV